MFFTILCYYYVMNVANQIRTAIANAPVVSREELFTRVDLNAPNVVASRNVPQFGLLLRTLVVLGETERFPTPDIQQLFRHETQHRHASDAVNGVLIGMGFRAVYLEEESQDAPRFQFFHKADYFNRSTPLQKAAVALHPYDPSRSDIKNAEDFGFTIQQVADLAYENNANGKPFIPPPLSVRPSLSHAA